MGKSSRKSKKAAAKQPQAKKTATTKASAKKAGSTVSGRVQPAYPANRPAKVSLHPGIIEIKGSGKKKTAAVTSDLFAKDNLVVKPPKIPEEQWKLPAGFKPDGSFATLGEVVTDRMPTYSLEALTDEQNKQLVVERIKRQQNYPERHMLGVGKVNRERAIAEIEGGTAAGHYIQETEQKLIQMMKAIAAKSHANG